MSSNAMQKIEQLNEQQSYDFQEDLQKNIVPNVENPKKSLEEFAKKVFTGTESSSVTVIEMDPVHDS